MRQSRLLVVLTVFAAVAAGVCALNVVTGFGMWVDARTNGSVPLAPVSFFTVLLVVPITLVAIGLVALQIYRGRWGVRLLWIALSVLLLAPLFLADGASGYVRSRDGFAQWAAAHNPAPIREWCATAVAPGGVASVPPDWWYLKNREVAVGVWANPSAVRPFITGPLPDEVRVLPTTGTVIMAWVPSGSSVRYFVVGPLGSARPVELDSDLIEWTRVSDGAWTGVQLSH